MAKDKSLSKEERKALKKAEKAKQESSSLTEASGVSKTKSDKKEKKDKKAKLAEKINEQLDRNSNVGADGEVVSDDEDEDMEDQEQSKSSSKAKGMTATRPIGALVPFANPLADEKVGKKVFKSVKKAAANRTLKRGVKEVVKALRKSPTSLPPSSGSSQLPLGVVVLAADISPMDVISHIPVLCEDHNIPYIYVTSRAELGMAGQTKRPTSVVMVAKEAVKKSAAATGKGADSEDADWPETYKGLVKVVEREGKHVKV